MSVYKPPNKPFYLYDFRLGGHRYTGTTGKKRKTDALAFEQERKQEVAASIAAITGATVDLAGAISLYIHDKGQHEVNAEATEKWFEWLIAELGANTPFHSLTTADIRHLVAKRRAIVSNATVNRSVTQLLQRVLNHMVSLDKQVPKIDWKSLKLPEARERVREMYASEEEAIRQNLRADILPAFSWAIESGMRQDEMLQLKWANIDFEARVVHIRGKGDKWADIPLTRQMSALLQPLRHNHPVFIFTYEQQQTRGGKKRGQRIPLTKTVLRQQFNKAIAAAGVKNLCWHDLRHTAATRLLRRSGDVTLVQKLLRHDRITTTMKYAHRNVEDLRIAMETTDQIPTQGTKRKIKLRNNKD